MQGGDQRAGERVRRDEPSWANFHQSALRAAQAAMAQMLLAQGAMNVVVVEKRADRSPELADRLVRAGCNVVRRVEGASALGQALKSDQAEIVVLELSSPDPALVREVGALGQLHDRPVAVFVDETEPEAIQNAVRAGISSYVVRGRDVDRLRDALEVARARYAEERALRSELAEVRSSLDDRKQVEKAKGQLMEREGIREQAAYDMMRRFAMQRNCKLIDVARAILERETF